MTTARILSQTTFDIDLPELTRDVLRSLDMPLILKKLLEKAVCWDLGRLDLTLPNGDTYRIGGKKDGPIADLHIKNARLARRVIWGGVLAFCESYIDEDWDSKNPAAVMNWFLENQRAKKSFLLDENKLSRAVSFVMHKLQRNTRAGSRKNIAAHYDLGNDFYSLWLDETMTYSAAVFDKGMSLPEAQINKYKQLAERIGLTKDHHVLEIGCGWGGFAEYAAGTIGAKVTSITISEEQFAYATERINKAGLSDKVEVLFKDYRDIEGQFDRIVSIEMIEAVGEDYWPTYFAAIEKYLKPGGKAGLQSITIDEAHFDHYRKKGDFIQMHIFPGGMLPTKTVIYDYAMKNHMRCIDMFSFGRDYAETLRIWNAAFQKEWPTIKTLGYDERFKRMWELYFMYCESGFDVGTIDVIHAVIEKPHEPAA